MTTNFMATRPAPRRMSRRGFLKVSATGIASAAVLSAMRSGPALAQSRARLVREFVAAAREYRVPVGLLMAMGYVNTHWEMPPPEASEYEKGDPHGRGSYGIMALVHNPSSDTLGEASRLTGIPVERLKTDRASNIRGGAALLAASQGARPPRLGDYFGAVSGGGGRGKDYRASAGIGAGDLYADQVFKVLRGGVSGVPDGVPIALAPQNLAARPDIEGGI